MLGFQTENYNWKDSTQHNGRTPLQMNRHFSMVFLVTKPFYILLNISIKRSFIIFAYQTVS